MHGTRHYPPPETPTCITSDECASDEYCDNDNVCQKKVDLNAACELTDQCQASQFCGYDNFCIDRLELGELCYNDFECKDGYICDEHCVIDGKTLGEHCEEFVLCQNDLQCINDHCQASVHANEACDDNHFCPQNYFCFSYNGESKCIKDHGTCTTDNDCSADSYCCTAETCSTKNICISYGEGPRENQNLACAYQTVPGLFEAMIQCEWKSPEAGDLYPNHANVLMTPIVMNTPHDSGTAQEIIFTTYNNGDGGAPSGQGTDINYYGVIRIINAETCALHESIFDDNNHIIGGSNIAAADVDNDGFVEIFAGRGTAQNTVSA